MKKFTKILLCVFVFSFFFINISNAKAQTLREMKEELQETISNKQAYEARRAEAQKKMSQYNTQIKSSTKEIEKCEDDIEVSRAKIDELEIEINEKNLEIEELLRFFQISSGENAYLEYIFGASSFTDFIYRSAVVEQLTNYNDNLIDEMYNLIEENKRLQKELEAKIVNLEKQITSLKSQLSKLNITLDDIDEHWKDLNAEIKATQAEIQFYEDYGCKLDQEISECLNVPYSTSFTRPTTSGRVSSNYGYRYIFGGTSFHRGIDIAISEGTPIYSSAAGYVAKKVVRASCGGNILYVQHNLNGTKYTTTYMHLKSFNVNVGDVVTMMTIIGYSGGGRSTQSYDQCTTGAHLHFGIFSGWTTSSSRSVDPRTYINFPAKGSRYYSRW